MIHPSSAHQACAVVKQSAPNIKPKLGIVLGSGLTSFVDDIENKISIAYETLPGFPQLTVKGHQGTLTTGTLAGCEIVC